MKIVKLRKNVTWLLYYLVALSLGAVITGSCMGAKQERRNIIEVGNFESGFAPFDKEGNSLRVLYPVRAGKYAAKFDLSKGNVRNEVAASRAKIGGTYWYGWSIFVPNNYVTVPGKEFVTQFSKWQSPREPKWTGSANCVLKTQNSRWVFRLNYQEKPTNKKIKKTSVDLGSYERGKWTDWVMHVKWSYKPDGFLKLYKNGKLVFTRNGPTYFNISKGPYFKMGIYMGINNPDWPDHGKVRNRTLYTDEYRMGNANATYEDVAPRND
jgi:hypothetical protein